MFVLRSPLAVVVFVVSILPFSRSLSPPPAASDASAITAASLPYGDPRLCRLGPLGEGVLGFEALPGGGWDNLRNQDAGLVTAINYTACKLTEDGRFLIPDGMYIVPIKSSRVESYAELYVHWNNYTSSRSKTINANAGLSIDGVGISGKFSDGYKNVKTSQYMDSSNTVRVQARYIRYKAKLQPDTPLQPAFRNRLLQICAHIELNKTDMATYESQLLVRDFGTHVVTSVDVGAALSQEDEVQASYVRKYSSDTSQIKASASASFFGVFNFGAGYTTTTTDTMVDEYTRSRTSSFIETYGGPVFQPSNYTANNWTANIDNNLVVMDRSGDPLHYLITPAVLPEVPETTVYQTYEHVREAVELYYKHNIYFGCTARDSPNFSFIANVDDDTCKPQLTNYTFGGVYQTCSNSGPVDVCAKYQQPNPRTGETSCPDGYDAVLINSGEQTVYSSGRSCHSCWLVATCCHDNTYRSTGNYDAYWCVATGDVPQQSGFLFGGLYSSQVANPMTQGMTCPSMFYPVRILTNLTVCISDDYELGTEYSLPFAGFYSCVSGNPLTVPKASSQPGGSMSLGSYMMAAGPTSWPHKCPKGYSQHLATVDHGCEINYCIKSGSLSMLKLPNVNRPPFIPAPQQTDHDEKNYVMLTPASGVAGYSWKQTNASDDGDAQVQYPNFDIFAGNVGSSLSGGAVAAITVFATLLCVLVVQVAVFACRKRNGSRIRHERNESPSEVAPLVNSQAVFSGQSDNAVITVS